jgi:hypothetical protein
MKKYLAPTQIFITKIPSHLELKGRIIDIISSDGFSRVSSPHEEIHKSDYPSVNVRRPWLDEFFTAVRPCMEEIQAALEVKSWSISGAWYQWYEHGDFHMKHMHPGCSFSAVYFMELPNSSVKTRIYSDSGSAAVKIPDISEGEVLFFPSAMMHESPPNFSGGRKIVVAFNCDFHA